LDVTMQGAQGTQNVGGMQGSQQSCPNCGMQRQQWKGNGGQGFQRGNQTYCCQGCADNTGCTC
jgi:hypothetical protein